MSMAPDLKVVPSEVDGWDVIRADEGTALTNHPTKESAERAAELRAREESLSEEGTGDVIVDPDHPHGIDDARQGVKPAFLSLTGLLIGIGVLIVVIGLIASLTGFGS